MFDGESVCKCEYVDTYPGCQSRVRFANGYDAFVAESVEELYKMLK